MAGSRSRTPERSSGQRVRPQDFKVRTRRTFDPIPYFVVFALLVGGGYYYYTRFVSSAKTGPGLVLKSSDKGLGIQSVFGTGLLEEGKPIENGSTIATKKALKSVFTFGSGGSMRVAPDSEFTLEGVDADKKGGGARLKLLKGRLWMISSPQARWYVTTPTAIVRTIGKVAEVRLDKDGGTTCVTWKGTAEMEPLNHPDRRITIPENNEASYDASRTLTHPHPLGLFKGDPFLNWNLQETLQLEIKEKEGPAGGGKKK